MEETKVNLNQLVKFFGRNYLKGLHVFTDYPTESGSGDAAPDSQASGEVAGRGGTPGPAAPDGNKPKDMPVTGGRKPFTRNEMSLIINTLDLCKKNLTQFTRQEREFLMPLMALSGHILLTESHLIPRSFLDTVSSLLFYILQFILNELVHYGEEEQNYSEEMLASLVRDFPSKSNYPIESLEYYRHFVKYNIVKFLGFMVQDVSSADDELKSGHKIFNTGELSRMCTMLIMKPMPDTLRAYSLLTTSAREALIAAGREIAYQPMDTTSDGARESKRIRLTASPGSTKEEFFDNLLTPMVNVPFGSAPHAVAVAVPKSSIVSTSGADVSTPGTSTTSSSAPKSKVTFQRLASSTQGDPSRSSNRAYLIIQNQLHFQYLSGSNILLNFINTYSVLRPFVRHLQAVEEGAALRFLKLEDSSEGSGRQTDCLLDTLCDRLMADLGVVEILFDLNRLLEPLLSDRVAKIILLTQAALHACLSMISHYNAHDLGTGVGDDINDSERVVKKMVQPSIEIEAKITNTFEKTIQLYTTAFEIFKGSNRVAGQICQNAHMFTVWLVFTDLQLILVTGKAAGGGSSIPGAETSSGSGSTSSGGSVAKRQGYGILCIPLAKHAIRLMACLLDDLHLEFGDRMLDEAAEARQNQPASGATGDEEASFFKKFTFSSKEDPKSGKATFKYDKAGQYSAWQRIDMIFSSNLSVVNLLFDYLSAGYRCAGTCRDNLLAVVADRLLRANSFIGERKIENPRLKKANKKKKSKKSKKNLNYVRYFYSEEDRVGEFRRFYQNNEEGPYEPDNFFEPISAVLDEDEAFINYMLNETDVIAAIASAVGPPGSANDLTEPDNDNGSGTSEKPKPAPRISKLLASMHRQQLDVKLAQLAEKLWRREEERKIDAHYELVLTILDHLNYYYVCSKIDPLREYFKQAISDTQLIVLSHIIQDLDFEKENIPLKFLRTSATFEKFSVSLMQLMHNLIAMQVLANEKQNSLLAYLGFKSSNNNSTTAATTSSKQESSWSLYRGTRSLAILGHVLLLRLRREKEEIKLDLNSTTMTIWRDFITQLKRSALKFNGDLSSYNEEAPAYFEDLNVEHAQLMLFLFHNLKLLQRKHVFYQLLLALHEISVELCSKNETNRYRERPISAAQMLFIARLLHIFEYMIKNLYDTPAYLFEQVNNNLLNVTPKQVEVEGDDDDESDDDDDEDDLTADPEVEKPDWSKVDNKSKAKRRNNKQRQSKQQQPIFFADKKLESNYFDFLTLSDQCDFQLRMKLDPGVRNNTLGTCLKDWLQHPRFYYLMDVNYLFDKSNTKYVTPKLDGMASNFMLAGFSNLSYDQFYGSLLNLFGFIGYQYDVDLSRSKTDWAMHFSDDDQEESVMVSKNFPHYGLFGTCTLDYTLQTMWRLVHQLPPTLQSMRDVINSVREFSINEETGGLANAHPQLSLAAEAARLVMTNIWIGRLGASTTAMIWTREMLAKTIIQQQPTTTSGSGTTTSSSSSKVEGSDGASSSNMVAVTSVQKAEAASKIEKSLNELLVQFDSLDFNCELWRYYSWLYFSWTPNAATDGQQLADAIKDRSLNERQLMRDVRGIQFPKFFSLMAVDMYLERLLSSFHQHFRQFPKRDKYDSSQSQQQRRSMSKSPAKEVLGASTSASSMLKAESIAKMSSLLLSVFDHLFDDVTTILVYDLEDEEAQTPESDLKYRLYRSMVDIGADHFLESRKLITSNVTTSLMEVTLPATLVNRVDCWSRLISRLAENVDSNNYPEALSEYQKVLKNGLPFEFPIVEMDLSKAEGSINNLDSFAVNLFSSMLLIRDNIIDLPRSKVVETGCANNSWVKLKQLMAKMLLFAKTLYFQQLQVTGATISANQHQRDAFVSHVLSLQLSMAGHRFIKPGTDEQSYSFKSLLTKVFDLRNGYDFYFAALHPIIFRSAFYILTIFKHPVFEKFSGHDQELFIRHHSEMGEEFFYYFSQIVKLNFGKCAFEEFLCDSSSPSTPTAERAIAGDNFSGSSSSLHERQNFNLIDLIEVTSHRFCSPRYASGLLKFVKKLLAQADKQPDDVAMTRIISSFADKLGNRPDNGSLLYKWFHLVLFRKHAPLDSRWVELRMRLPKDDAKLVSTPSEDDDDAIMGMKEIYLLYKFVLYSIKNTSSFDEGVIDEMATAMLHCCHRMLTETMFEQSDNFLSFTGMFSSLVLLYSNSGPAALNGHLRLVSEVIGWLEMCEDYFKGTEITQKVKTQVNQGRQRYIIESVYQMLSYLTDIFAAFQYEFYSSGKRTKSESESGQPADEEAGGGSPVTTSKQSLFVGDEVDFDSFLLPDQNQPTDEEDDEDTEDENLCQALCTFTTTQKEFINQHWYNCHTCNMVDGVGVCTVCAQVCHRGHDVTYSKHGSFFCDCGGNEEGGCRALTPRQPSTKTKVAKKAAASAASKESKAAYVTGGAKTRGTRFCKQWCNTVYSQDMVQWKLADNHRLLRNKFSNPNVNECYEHFGLKTGKIDDKIKPKLLEQMRRAADIIFSFFKHYMPILEHFVSNESELGYLQRVRAKFTALQSNWEPLSVEKCEDLASPVKFGSDPVFDNVQITTEQSQAVRHLTLITGALVRRQIMCLMRSRQQGVHNLLLVAHDKNRMSVVHLNQLLTQVYINPSSKKKLHPQKLATINMPFTIMNISHNQLNNEVVAVCGLKECHILAITQNGTVTGHRALNLSLDTNNHIVKPMWLPDSQSELAIVTLDFIKIFDITRESDADFETPIYHFVIPSRKIRDMTFVYSDQEEVEEQRRYILILSGRAQVYAQVLGAEMRGTPNYYVTNQLTMEPPCNTTTAALLGANSLSNTLIGFSLYYSHTMQLLFLSFLNSETVVAPFTIENIKRKNISRTTALNTPIGQVMGNLAVMTEVHEMIASETGTAMALNNNQPLLQWQEVPEHPGLIFALTLDTSTPVVMMVNENKISLQELNPRRKVLDLVALSVSPATLSNPVLANAVLNGPQLRWTTMVNLCEDGSLQIYRALNENTSIWLKPSYLNFDELRYTTTGGIGKRAKLSSISEGGAAANTTTKAAGKKTTGEGYASVAARASSSGNANTSATRAEPKFPIDFFEHCTVMNDIEFGGADISELYNSQQIKNRLSSATTYIACTKPNGFKISVAQTGNDQMVIAGIRVNLGVCDPVRAPTAVEVFGRSKIVNINRHRWFDIPFTNAEMRKLMEPPRAFEIRFAPSTDVNNVTIVDSLKVYGKPVTSALFEYDQESSGAAVTSTPTTTTTAAKSAAPARRAVPAADGDDLEMSHARPISRVPPQQKLRSLLYAPTITDDDILSTVAPYHQGVFVLNRLFASCLDVLEASFSFQEAAQHHNWDSKLLQDQGGAIEASLIASSKLLNVGISDRLARSVCGLLARLIPARATYDEFRDERILEMTVSSLQTYSPNDVIIYAHNIALMRDIVSERPRNFIRLLAKTVNVASGGGSDGSSTSTAASDIPKGALTMATFLCDTFWGLYRERPEYDLLAPVSRCRLFNNLESLIDSLVFILYATMFACLQENAQSPCAAGKEQQHSTTDTELNIVRKFTTMMLRFLMHGNLQIAYAAKRSLSRVLSNTNPNIYLRHPTERCIKSPAPASFYTQSTMSKFTTITKSPKYTTSTSTNTQTEGDTVYIRRRHNASRNVPPGGGGEDTEANTAEARIQATYAAVAGGYESSTSSGSGGLRRMPAIIRGRGRSRSNGTNRRGASHSNAYSNALRRLGASNGGIAEIQRQIRDRLFGEGGEAANRNDRNAQNIFEPNDLNYEDYRRLLLANVPMLNEGELGEYYLNELLNEAPALAAIRRGSAASRNNNQADRQAAAPGAADDNALLRDVVEIDFIEHEEDEEEDEDEDEEGNDEIDDLIENEEEDDEDVDGNVFNDIILDDEDEDVDDDDSNADAHAARRVLPGGALNSSPNYVAAEDELMQQVLNRIDNVPGGNIDEEMDERTIQSLRQEIAQNRARLGLPADAAAARAGGAAVPANVRNEQPNRAALHPHEEEDVDDEDDDDDEDDEEEFMEADDQAMVELAIALSLQDQGNAADNDVAAAADVVVRTLRHYEAQREENPFDFHEEQMEYIRSLQRDLRSAEEELVDLEQAQALQQNQLLLGQLDDIALPPPVPEGFEEAAPRDASRRSSGGVANAGANAAGPSGASGARADDVTGLRRLSDILAEHDDTVEPRVDIWNESYDQVASPPSQPSLQQQQRQSSSSFGEEGEPNSLETSTSHGSEVPASASKQRHQSGGSVRSFGRRSARRNSASDVAGSSKSSLPAAALASKAKKSSRKAIASRFCLTLLKQMGDQVEKLLTLDGLTSIPFLQVLNMLAEYRYEESDQKEFGETFGQIISYLFKILLRHGQKEEDDLLAVKPVQQQQQQLYRDRMERTSVTEVLLIIEKLFRMFLSKMKHMPEQQLFSIRQQLKEGLESVQQQQQQHQETSFIQKLPAPTKKEVTFDEKSIKPSTSGAPSTSSSATEKTIVTVSSPYDPAATPSAAASFVHPSLVMVLSKSISNQQPILDYCLTILRHYFEHYWEPMCKLCGDSNVAKGTDSPAVAFGCRSRYVQNLVALKHRRHTLDVMPVDLKPFFSVLPTIDFPSEGGTIRCITLNIESGVTVTLNLPGGHDVSSSSDALDVEPSNAAATVHNVFDRYVELHTENILRWTYQLKKLAASFEAGQQQQASNEIDLNSPWIEMLCEYMMLPNLNIHILKMARKVLAYICGSREKYRQVRDYYTIKTNLKAIRRIIVLHFLGGDKENGRKLKELQLTEKDLDDEHQLDRLIEVIIRVKFVSSDPNEDTKDSMMSSDQHRLLSLPYTELIALVDYLKACVEIADVRVANWQCLCRREFHIVVFLFRISLLFGEGISSIILQLLSLALFTNGVPPMPTLEKEGDVDDSQKEKPTTTTPADSKKKDSPASINIEQQKQQELCRKVFAQLDRPILTQFIRYFLLESNASNHRWGAHSLLYGLYQSLPLPQQEYMLELFWSLWPNLACYGKRAAQFVDLLGYFTLKTEPAPDLDSASTSTGDGQAKIAHVIEQHYVESAIGLLKYQNQILSKHSNANIYTSLQSLLDFGGYYLETDPCLVCNNPEVPFSNVKLSQIKLDARFTTNTHIIKLNGSQTITRITAKITDLKKTKMVKTLTIYYNNRQVQSVVELKNRSIAWQKAKSVGLTFSQSELKIDFALPIVACNLMIEYSSFYETPHSSTETLQCPRCSSIVPANPGVCINCGENVFQCHKCRAINYDEKDPFLCNSCGFCKYAKFDFYLMARSTATAVEPIENEEDRAKAVQSINNLMEKADKIYKQILTARPALEQMTLASQGFHATPDVIGSLFGGNVINIINMSTAAHTAPGAGANAAPASTSANTLSAVNRFIQELAMRYNGECRQQFEEMSKIVQRVLYTRKELVDYDNRQNQNRHNFDDIRAAFLQQQSKTSTSLKQPLSDDSMEYDKLETKKIKLMGGDWKAATAMTSMVMPMSGYDTTKMELEDSAPSGSNFKSHRCYGCCSATIEHCITLLKALAFTPHYKDLLIKSSLFGELIDYNLRLGSPLHRSEVSSLLCLLTRDNVEATEQFNTLLLAKIRATFQTPFMTSADVGAVRHEMALMTIMFETQDNCWELRLRCLMKLFLLSLQNKSPAILEVVTLPCLRILYNLLMKAPGGLADLASGKGVTKASLAESFATVKARFAVDSRARIVELGSSSSSSRRQRFTERLYGRANGGGLGLTAAAAAAATQSSRAGEMTGSGGGAKAGSSTPSTTTTKSTPKAITVEQMASVEFSHSMRGPLDKCLTSIPFDQMHVNVSVDLASWLNPNSAAASQYSVNQWRLRNLKVSDNKDPSISSRSEIIARKYAARWLYRHKSGRLRSIRSDCFIVRIASSTWIQEVLFNPTSKALRLACRQLLAALFEQLAGRQRTLIDLFTSYLDDLCTVGGEIGLEFYQLYRSIIFSELSAMANMTTKTKSSSSTTSPTIEERMVKNYHWRYYLTQCGLLQHLGKLITLEIERLQRLEETTLSTNFSQGSSLYYFVMLLNLFMCDDRIRRVHKSSMVGFVLDGYLSLRKLIVQRTKMVDESQAALLDLLELLTTGTKAETINFMKICIETVRKYPLDDLRTPVFIFERLCSIIYPEEKDADEFFITLDKDPMQEDFVQGRMLGNPYSSKDAGLGPLMRNIKNKICQECDLVALLEDDSGLELLVNNKIISLDLPVKEVYKKLVLAEANNAAGTSNSGGAVLPTANAVNNVWSSLANSFNNLAQEFGMLDPTGTGIISFANAAYNLESRFGSAAASAATSNTNAAAPAAPTPGPTMKIVYRIRGLMGDATEEFIESFSTKDSDVVEDNEKLYELANIMATNIGQQDSSKSGLMVMLERFESITAINNRSRMLMMVLLKLFGYCVRVKVNRQALIAPEMKTIQIMLGVVRLFIETKHSDLLVTPASPELPSYFEQLLTIMEKLLMEASQLDITAWDRFNRETCGRPLDIRLWMHSLIDPKSVLYNTNITPLTAKMLRVLAFLSLGDREKTEALLSHFKPYFDFQDYDRQQSIPIEMALFAPGSANSGSSTSSGSTGANTTGAATTNYGIATNLRYELFCSLLTGIEHNQNGARLKDVLIENGFVDTVINYLTQNAPQMSSLLVLNSEQWQAFIERPSLKYILRILTGLSQGHERTQMLMRQLIPIIHSLEQLLTDSHMATLAENLMEAIKECPAVEAKIQEVRLKTRDEKKRIAMVVRERQLTELGMRSNDKGQVMAGENLLRKLDHQLGDEKGLICSICREGYAFQPQKVLAIYTFTKRCDVEEYEDRLPRKTIGYTTVTHFNIIHFECHLAAVRHQRSRDEWQSAALHNASTRCNGLLPLWGPGVSESVFAQALSRHNSYLQDAVGQRDFVSSNSFLGTVNDLKLLLLRYAQNKPFHEETGGGGPQSNLYLTPYLMHTALYVMITSKVIEREQANLNTFVNEKSAAKWIESSFQADSPYLYTTISVILQPRDWWLANRIYFLRRLILCDYVRQLPSEQRSPSHLSGVQAVNYNEIKSALMFFAMINLFYVDMFKNVEIDPSNASKASAWSEALATYIRNNDVALAEAAERMLDTFQNDIAPSSSFEEFCDAIDLVRGRNAIENPSQWLKDAFNMEQQ